MRLLAGVVVLTIGCSQPAVPYTPGRVDAIACPANAPGSIGNGFDSHDDCLVDQDCAADQACLCQTPDTDRGGVPPTLGNVCVTGNCRTDRDCANGAGCTLDDSCANGEGYFCQTADDECRTSADCSGAEACVLDPGRGYWACETQTCPG